MSDKLKPCPFCGGEAKTEPFGTWVRIKCLSPGNRCKNAPVRIWRTEVEAIAAWNTRVLDEASYRAGLEAAARVLANHAKAASQRYARELMGLVVDAILLLPTPSNLPQEGGRRAMLGFAWLLRSEAARRLGWWYSTSFCDTPQAVYGVINDALIYLFGKQHRGWTFSSPVERNAVYALLTRYTARTEDKQ